MSLGRITLTGPPQLCTQPQPDVTMSVWPSGCVCQLLRAPGSKVTTPPLTRDGAGALKSWSMRTVPVKYSAGPLAEGCDPFRLSSIAIISFPDDVAAAAVLDRLPSIDDHGVADDEARRVRTQPHHR